MDSAYIEQHVGKIAEYLLALSLKDYSKPFQTLYIPTYQQLQKAIRYHQEIQRGGKYLNKLPAQTTLEAGKALLKQRLIQLVTDICYFLTPMAKARLKQEMQATQH